MKRFEEARNSLKEWKGDTYGFGLDVLHTAGEFAAAFGRRTMLVVADLGLDWAKGPCEKVTASLQSHGVTCSVVLGALPNTPREDVYRIANEVSKTRPDSIVALGGGSTIDSAKCASVISRYPSSQLVEHLGVSPALASTVEPLFGVGNVTKLKEATGIAPIPVVAVQTIASSAAHLTKYCNITDPTSGQKKLIVDPAIVPPKAVFDYGITVGAPKALTLDGGLDGISHLWEVFMGATGQPYYDTIRKIALEGIRLIVEYLPKAVANPADLDARIALGFGTDLGGYAIMIGGTSGPHLGSFSLVDILSHGRACALLNPYYTVLFAPAIQDQLRSVGTVFQDAGFITPDLNSLEGRELGEAVAKGMIAFLRNIDFPASLREAGASEAHINRMLAAAMNPQLESKLKNMPIPMNPSKGDVEAFMKPVLHAAFTGDISLIKSMKI